jgi:hypothetical protein
MSWRTAKSEFDSGQGQEICLISTTFRPSLGCTLPPRASLPGGGGVKEPGRETGDVPPCGADVRNGRS